MFQRLLVHFFSVALFIVIHSQCTADPKKPILNSWHDKFHWNAEDFFTDPKVRALCHAIQANDLKAIEQQIANGADVNTKGKGNMTPLLWAYPDNKPERFKLLLEHGADPNVIFESDFNTNMSGIRPGDSVTHMVCSTWFPKYFDYVFQHGGDPNLWNRDEHNTPLFLLLLGPAKDKSRKIQRLIELGADVDANKNNEHTGGFTPVMVATSGFGQYDLALQLLRAGADYKAYMTNINQKLIHIVVNEEGRMKTTKQKTDYEKLVKWLEDHGETIDKARDDLKRWRSWSRSSGEYRRNMDAEIAERKAPENRELGK